MGSCNFKSELDDVTISICKSQFQFHFVIGRGGYGKVWKVELKKTREVFAMKEMSKSRVIAKKSEKSVLNEKLLLNQLKHKYLVNMHYAFQDRENLYLVMDLMPGGDLRSHICQHSFNERQCRFLICCILMGLEYMHSNLILHRDIKPENLVFDNKGFLHITDLGISRVWTSENFKDTSGTPGYMAPEVMCRQNHGVASDYYAVGVIAYEIMMKQRPYMGRSRKDIRDEILAKQAKISAESVPQGWSAEAADFVNKVNFMQLLKRKPVNRLGLNGPQEVKNHPWLKNVDWGKMSQMTEVPPYQPSDSSDNYNFRASLTDENEPDPTKTQESSINNVFQEYYFNIHDNNSQAKHK